MTNNERAEVIIETICHRLRSLAANRPFRFVYTARRDAESYLRKQTRFEGYSEDDVSAAEHRLNVSFPTVFRTYLRRLGKAHGELFIGSDVAGLGDFEQFRTRAEDLLRDSKVSGGLPPDSVVFLLHQGYTCCYFVAENHFDCPILNYVEGETQATQSCGGFEEFMLSEVQLMAEVNKKSLEQGGYFLSISDDGTVGRQYPALSSGLRPIEVEDAFVD